MRHLVDAGAGDGWLDIGSYGRRGLGRRDRLSAGQVEFIARTVRRTPEVMIKMLNRGGTDLCAVSRHLKYLDRDGELPIHTDEAEDLKGKKAATELIDDWDLGLEESRPVTADHKPRLKAKPPKLVHKILFSMPAGTPPDRVLRAVKSFAREEFGAKHRYAMVLHTDEPHPHVHMVVKAMGHDGKRLNIRRQTLREWRRQFARRLREQGVEANASERQVRGVTKPRKTDGIYRAGLRRASTHWLQRAEAVAREVSRSAIPAEPGKAQLLETRRQILRGWSEVADDLDRQNLGHLALAVRRFMRTLPPVRTERDWIRDEMQGHEKARGDHERERAR